MCAEKSTGAVRYQKLASKYLISYYEIHFLVLVRRGSRSNEASPVLNLFGTEVKWWCKKDYDAPRLTHSPTLQDGAEGPGREAARNVTRRSVT